MSVKKKSRNPRRERLYDLEQWYEGKIKDASDIMDRIIEFMDEELAPLFPGSLVKCRGGMEIGELNVEIYCFNSKKKDAVNTVYRHVEGEFPKFDMMVTVMEHSEDVTKRHYPEIYNEWLEKRKAQSNV